MSKKIRFLSGGALGADGKPLVWEISREPALSKPLYVFVPGAAVDVADSDAAWFLDPANTGGRVFEAVRPPGSPPPVITPISPAVDSATTPEADAPEKPKPSGQAGGR